MKTGLVLTVRRLSLMVLALAHSCESVEKRIGKHGDELRSRQAEYAADPTGLPIREIGWEQAVARLDSNLVMRAANEEIIKARNASKRVFLDLIPSINLSGSLSRGLTGIQIPGSSDAAMEVDALFPIPGVIRIRLQYYAAALARLKAEKMRELARRQETVKLYQIFREHGRREDLQAAEALRLSDPDAPAAERDDSARRDKAARVEQWLALSALLGDYSSQWRPLDGSLPNLAGLAVRAGWDEPARTNSLFITLQAIELEAARMRKLGAAFRYWPNLQMNVFAPPLYSTDGRRDDSPGFRADNLRFDAFAWMDLDTSLALRDERREISRETGLLREKLSGDSHALEKKLQVARLQFMRLEERRQKLDALDRWLQSLPPPRDFTALKQQKARQMQLLTDRLVLEKEHDAVLSVLWMSDEALWQTTPPKAPPEPAAD